LLTDQCDVMRLFAAIGRAVPLVITGFKGVAGIRTGRCTDPTLEYSGVDVRQPMTTRLKLSASAAANLASVF